MQRVSHCRRRPSAIFSSVIAFVAERAQPTARRGLQLGETLVEPLNGIVKFRSDRRRLDSNDLDVALPDEANSGLQIGQSHRPP